MMAALKGREKKRPPRSYLILPAGTENGTPIFPQKISLHSAFHLRLGGRRFCLANRLR
jgi:hypothetical protein